jgi:imidazole glycerol-phosphate synthase subunit HisF
MHRPRIIPVLLLSNKDLVKSIKFKNHHYIGDPLNAVKLFNDLKADELVFLDIYATKNKKLISTEMVQKIGEEANMPFSVGGGIKTLNDIEVLIKAGAERVIIGNEAATNPKFITEASKTFGASTIAVCIDFKKNMWGKELVYTNNGSDSHKFSPLEFAKMQQDNGAGEVVLQSIEYDGTMNGYHVEAIKQIAQSLTIPVVALGGAGKYTHLKEMFQQYKVCGLGSGSTFIYQGKMRGVLINYPTQKEKEEIYE